jgi:protein-tyrosine phosphatase
MIKICFVCLGNICRSPMAEFIMKDKIKKLNLEDKYYIESRATSYEEEGNDMHISAKEILNLNNISYTKHKAKRLEIEDYQKFDYFICMDDSNVRNTINIFKNDNFNKVFKLNKENVKDPWYTGNFNETYNDLNEGIDKILRGELDEK